MTQPVLAGRRAVVTGASRGIGLAIAEALHAAGAGVVLADVDGPAAQAAAAALGMAAQPVECDVADEASVAALRDAASADGTVDVLVNNAGVLTVAEVVDAEWSDWTRTMAVNAGGAFLCSRAFLPGMIAAGGGAIVNVASIAGKRGDPGLAAYSASKAALIALTQSLAQEVGSHAVTVNAVCPGTVPTEMMAGLAEDWGQTVPEVARDLQALPDPQAPAQIADAVLFLIANAAVTGQAINVDGGTVFH